MKLFFKKYSGYFNEVTSILIGVHHDFGLFNAFLLSVAFSQVNGA